MSARSGGPGPAGMCVSVKILDGKKGTRRIGCDVPRAANYNFDHLGGWPADSIPVTAPRAEPVFVIIRLQCALSEPCTVLPAISALFSPTLRPRPSFPVDVTAIPELLVAANSNRCRLANHGASRRGDRYGTVRPAGTRRCDQSCGYGCDTSITRIPNRGRSDIKGAIARNSLCRHLLTRGTPVAESKVGRVKGD
jgi:hypothetical protein